ncbi:hypothetical protein B0T22DRAFT_483186 [Podospora appendiculata]|uniref:Uncharacterized protein n=1 Tax=Podospora appendiculata TaxID=314037 RepID=A0AAE0X2J8_9PEZI|nr:hypothetical protein B0T22DRAFT_483186 [Podospora appendiculata]
MDSGVGDTGNHQLNGENHSADAAPQDSNQDDIGIRTDGQPNVPPAASMIHQGPFGSMPGPQAPGQHPPHSTYFPGQTMPAPHHGAPETLNQESRGNMKMPDSRHGAVPGTIFFASVPGNPHGYRDLNKMIENERARLGGWRVNATFTIDAPSIDRETVIEAERFKENVRAHPPATLPPALVKDALMDALANFHPQSMYPYQSELYRRVFHCRELAIRTVALDGLPGHYGHAVSEIFERIRTLYSKILFREMGYAAFPERGAGPA